MDAVTTAITGITTDVTAVIPAALGVGVLVVGSLVAWRVAKRFFA